MIRLNVIKIKHFFYFFGIFKTFRKYYRSDRESFRDLKSLENFLMHFSTGIMTLNAYSLQEKEYSKTSLMELINLKNA
jgi:hypothetical protein